MILSWAGWVMAEELETSEKIKEAFRGRTEKS